MESACFSVSQCWILLLALLCGCGSADETVLGFIGRDVTLTCRYDSQYYGTLAVCWGKGTIPNSGCGNEVIRSDGTTVTSRASERYVLQGDLTKGDVSLTIRQLEEKDSGTYGCRVDIPGWFNDHKHHATLSVHSGPPDPVRLELRERGSRTVLLRWTAGFDGGSPLTGYILEQKDMTVGQASVKTTSISAQLTRASVTDLQPFSTYIIRLFSRNAVGTSVASNILTVSTKEEAPGGPPLDVQVHALSSSSLEVFWKPPRMDLRYGVIQRYIVGYRISDTSPNQPWSTMAPNRPWNTVAVYPTARRLVLGNLSVATQYAVSVQAVNGEGGGPVSTLLVCSTLEDEHTTPIPPFMADTTSTPVEPDLPPPILTVSPTVIRETAESIQLSCGTPPSLSVSPVCFFDIRDKQVTRIHSCQNIYRGSDLLKWARLDSAAEVTLHCLYTVKKNGKSRTSARSNPVSVTFMVDTTSTVSETMTDCTHQEIVWDPTAFPEGQEEVSTLSTGNPQSTSFSNKIQASISEDEEESYNRRLIFILIPVALVALIVVMTILWQLKRLKRRKANLEILWKNNGSLAFSDTQLLSDI